MGFPCVYPEINEVKLHMNKYKIVKETHYDSETFTVYKKVIGIWTMLFDFGGEYSSFNSREKAIEAIDRDRFPSKKTTEYV